MIGPLVLAFLGGALAGVLAALLFRTRIKLLDEIPTPTISTVTCLSGSQIQIGGATGTTPEGMNLVALYARVYDDPNQVVPATPDGATLAGTSFPITLNLPLGLAGPSDLAVVWAEYQAYTKNSLVYSTCSGSGSGSGSGGGTPMPGVARALSPAAAAQLEAVPRAYRVSPGSPAVGAEAELAGALAGAAETVLHYVPEDSTPLEPFWRSGRPTGLVREWSLRLLHRNDGFGGLLSAVCLLGSRELRLTWVTSDWRFHAANRLRCESDEAAGLSLLVQPV